MIDRKYKTPLKKRISSKKYRESNKEYYKKYNKEYREKNKDKAEEYLKEYYQNNKEHLVQKATRWNKDNIEKHRKFRREAGKKYRKKYPERIKANKREGYHQRKSNKCSICGSTENLHFHHTDYEKDEGFTVCAKCHKNVQRRKNGTKL